MLPPKIDRQRIFISHSYAYHEEYLKLVAMLDRASERNATWRWENLSVPRDVPLMTDEEARQAETYIGQMRRRKAFAHVVLLIAHPEAMDSESVFLEAYEAMPRHRPEVPVPAVLPRGAVLEDRYAGWGIGAVKWHPRSIIRAVRKYASPASPGELRLTAGEELERSRIVAARDRSDWQRIRTARALGISRGTLWKKMRAYVINRDQSLLSSE